MTLSVGLRRGGDVVADKGSAQSDGEDILMYRGRTWTVTSEPVVVDSHDGHDLVEVWVRRGEDIGERS
ncbi:hypothetical protein ACFW08_05685 [Streptomyces sp. NPDC058960]|uniref:hypothetical protein n=1 Tax=Streptomyces sp. NPDC058960 TaxID=3346679 RepID=UPI00369F30A7